MPPLADTRSLATFTTRLYDPGQGDPIITDHGFRWYQAILLNPQGTPSYNATTGLPHLEIVPDVGLLCRPILRMKDTRLTQYTTSGGEWEELRSDVVPTVYRLHQFDTTANAAPWSAESKFPLPFNPEVAFSLVFFDSPPDQDVTTNPPFQRIEFGGDPAHGVEGHAIEFSKQFGCRLLVKIAGAWRFAAPLPEPQPPGGTESDECFIFLRVHRGKILISMDLGRTYAEYARPDGEPIYVEAAKYTLRGQGCMAYLGLHQLDMAQGTWDAIPQDTLTSRLLTVVQLAWKGLAPAGTSIALTDTSTPLMGRARWRATLTPQAIPGTPFTFYRSPELYAVRFRYPVQRTVALGTYTQPWDGDTELATVSKPYSLDGATATLQVMKDPATVIDLEALRWRKVQQIAGFHYEDGSEVSEVFFTGYIAAPTVSGGAEDAFDLLNLEIENATIRAKRMKWEHSTVPLDGLTVNQGLDECLDAMGLTAADRVWHASGNFILIPEGSPEEPCLWPQPGEPIWDAMKRICDGAKLELFCDDLGIWRTLPLNYVDAAVSHVFEALPVLDDTRSIQQLSQSFDAREAATAVLLEARDQYGFPLYAYAVDTEAEGNVLSNRHCPWRELEYEKIEGRTSPGWLMFLAQGRFSELVPLKMEPEANVPMRIDVARRQRVEFTGSERLDIQPGEDYAILTLQQEVRPRISDCRTVAGVRRL